MNKRYWLRGLAVGVGISGVSGFSSVSLYAQHNGGLQLNSYPYSTVAHTSGPINIGSYPSLAQNTPTGGHVHIPQGTYTNADQAGQLHTHVPQNVPQVTPLPPIQSSAPMYTQSTQLPTSASPMYSVPPQAVHQAGTAPMQYAPAPQPVPMAHVESAPVGTIYQGVNSSCSSCNQGVPSQAPIYHQAPVYQPAPVYQAPMITNYAPAVAVPRVVSVNPWFVGAGALIFNRYDNEEVRLSSSVTPGAPPISGPKLLSTLDARMETSGGFQAFGGRYFGCGRYALMGTYWGLYPADRTVTILDPAGGVGVGDYLRTDLPLTISAPGGGNEHGIEMPDVGGPILGPDGGRTGYDWMTNSFAQRLVRSQDFNNVEISLFSFGLSGAARNGLGVAGGGYGLGHGHGMVSGWQNGQFGRTGYSQAGGCGQGDCGSSYGDCGSCNSGCNTCQTCAVPCSGPTSPCGPITGAQCSRLRFSLLGGLRWFRFNDFMEYAASDNDAIFGNGDDFYYRNTLRNDLLGFQLGGLANYCVGSRVNLYASSKAGIFGNRISYDSFAGTDSTTAIISSYSSAYDNQEYEFTSNKTSLSVLGEFETGLGVRLTQGITGTCGYRVVGVSGVATAPGQVPYDFSDFNAVRRIQDNGSLILHGLSIGGMYNW